MSRTGRIAIRSPIRPQPERRPPARSVLPAPLTTLVGREADVASVRGLLTDPAVRLVTLCGPGGVGKTRLAIQVAAEERRSGIEVGFASLSASTEPEHVAAVLAESLDIRSGGNRAGAAHLIDAIGTRPLLLVLDNFEQVLSAGPLVAELLGACPNLTVLVTSRSRVRLSGERVVDVLPLGVPEATRAFDPNDLSAFSAVQLFVERAQATRDSFRLTAENASTVAAICRRLDGLPLAIELAAAKSRLLGPDDLLRGLDRSLSLLTDGPRDQPARLQTMRAAIAWSYAFLSPEAQALFRQLSVFEGGCSLEAAVTVSRWRSDLIAAGISDLAQATEMRLMSADGPARAVVMDQLAALEESSLIRISAGRTGDTRIEMLQTVREFGLEALVAADEEPAARTAHAMYVLDLVDELDREMRDADIRAGQLRSADEVGNIQAALQWWYRQGGTPAGIRLAEALYWAWLDAGTLRQGHAGLDRLLATPGALSDPKTRAKALCISADLATWSGDFGAARPLFEEALRLSREVNDPRGVIFALRGLGNVELGETVYERAETVLREAAELARSEEDFWNLGITLNLLGITVRAMGRNSESREIHREARRLSEESGNRINAFAAIANEGLSALELGDLPAVRGACHELAGIVRRHADSNPLLRCLMLAGGIAAETGQFPMAVRLYARMTAAEAERGTPTLAAVQAPVDRRLAVAREALGETEYADAWAAGLALSQDDALALVAAVVMPVSKGPMPDGPASDGLTARERDVLRLIVAGLTDKEIADHLSISRRTASKHVATILAKLGVSSRTSAAIYAARHGLD